MIPEPPKDKRTRAYKDWFKEYGEDYKPKKIKSSKGVGDVVETITKKTGIKKAVKKVTDDCGCDELKAALNKKYRFSYNRQVLRCMTPEQAETFSQFAEKYSFQFEREEYNKIPLTVSEQQFLIETGIHLFATDYTTDLKRGCSSCKKYLIIDIKRVFDQ